jgi:threonine dehydratase
VHPFDDPDVIAGQGTIGMEILRQHSAPIHAIFVAIGGGGLISGVAAYVSATSGNQNYRRANVDSDAMARSLKAGKRVALSDVGLFSDGTAVKLVGEETFRLAKCMSTRSSLWIPTQSVPRSRMYFRIPAAFLSLPALAVAGCKAYIERQSK